MQRIINGMAVIAFMLSSSMTAALVISFFQLEAVQRAAVQRITGEISEAVEDELKKNLTGSPIPSF